MPYNSEKIPLPRSLDRRCKYSEEDYENVRKLFAGGMAKRAIARETGISRSSVNFIIHPERRVENVKRRNERGYKMSTEESTKATREHRQYKQRLKIEGKI